MTGHTMSYRVLAIVFAVSTIAGCASTGTAKKLTAADAGLLPGVWTGTMNPPGGSGTIAGTLTIKPDGTYTVEAGAFTSTGKSEIKDGVVQFVSTGGSGALAAGDRSGSATLMDRDTRWGLVGSGRGSVAGPYNFEVSKAK